MDTHDVHVGENDIAVVEGSFLRVGGDGLQVRCQLLTGVVQIVGGIAELGDEGGFRLTADAQLPLSDDGIGEFVGVAHGGGEDLAQGHIQGRPGLNGDLLLVGLQMDGMPGPELGLGKDAVAGHQIDVLLGNVGGESGGRIGVVVQAPAGSLLGPLGGVPTDETIDVSEIQDTITEVNRTAIAHSEFLSNQLLYYSHSDDCISICKPYTRD